MRWPMHEITVFVYDLSTHIVPSHAITKFCRASSRLRAISSTATAPSKMSAGIAATPRDTASTSVRRAPGRLAPAMGEHKRNAHCQLVTPNW